MHQPVPRASTHDASRSFDWCNLPLPDRNHAFDRITQLVSKVLRVPVSLISVVSSNHQTFVSQVGLGVPWSETRRTPLTHSFCWHPVTTRKPLVIDDARLDAELCRNGAIVDLNVIAYCGVPIMSKDGTVFGALCAIDTKPKRWSTEDIEIVRHFADLVAAQLLVDAENNHHSRVQNALQATEAKFKAFMDHSPAVAYIKDEDGRMLYVNETLCRYFPDARSWIGCTDNELWAPDVAKALRTNDLKAMASETGIELEEVVPGVDGQLSYWLTFKFPLQQPDGRTLLAGMSININDRKRAEALLIDQSDRLRLALKAGRMGKFSICASSGTVTHDEQMNRLHGLDLATGEWSIDSCIRRLHPGDTARVNEQIESDLRSNAGTGHTIEFRIVRPDGAVRWISSSAIIGKPGEMVGVQFDITDQRTSEEQLRAAKEAAELLANRAEAASQAKSLFLTNISHEIRTPLTAIFGYADMLLVPDQLPANRLECVQTIRRNGEHLLSVINDVLDLSKIEAGQMTVERTTTDLPQVVSDVVSLMKQRAESKSVSMKVVLDSPLPVQIATDPTRLRQILLNLVGNALKFTEQGWVEVRLAVDESELSPPVLRVAITDTGIGMSEEQQSLLFTPFSQVDPSHTRRFGGSGMGLSISRRLARLLGGDIAASSTFGVGSTFTVEIPTGSLAGIQRVETLTTQTVPPLKLEGANTSSPLGRILLAEDSADNQRFLKSCLTSAGATVDVADNGKVALSLGLNALCVGEPYDVILMDIQMPELDGYGAVAALRAAGYTRPIIALTANALDHERDRCLACGCDHFITKPIKTAEFLAVVRRFTMQAQKDPVTEVDGNAMSSALALDPIIAPLLDQFLDELALKITAICTAVDADNSREVSRIAHQIRGTAGNYGFPTITAAAAKTENVISSGRTLSAAAQAIDELVAQCNRAVAGRATNCASGGQSINER